MNKAEITYKAEIQGEAQRIHKFFCEKVASVAIKQRNEASQQFTYFVANSRRRLSVLTGTRVKEIQCEIETLKFVDGTTLLALRDIKIIFDHQDCGEA
jgi:hypothetical protein